MGDILTNSFPNSFIRTGEKPPSLEGNLNIFCSCAEDISKFQIVYFFIIDLKNQIDIAMKNEREIMEKRMSGNKLVISY